LIFRNALFFVRLVSHTRPCSKLCLSKNLITTYQARNTQFLPVLSWFLAKEKGMLSICWQLKFSAIKNQKKTENMGKTALTF